MSNWLDPLRVSLDGPAMCPPLFFRDDDAGWQHERFRTLLDVFARRGIPIDVAAIPAALTPEISRDLRAAADAMSGGVSVHQHGFRHVNHESHERKSEFGPSRNAAEQSTDIAEGRMRLEQALGKPARPVFTPPWNRCTTTTVRCLVDLGFQVLSRDVSAGRAGVPGLIERPITLDWSGKHGVCRGRDEWGRQLAATLTGEEPVGMMLHHGVMDADDFGMLADLLDVLSSHPEVRIETIGPNGRH
jgi:peptidoglycan/xylan/chitin deacetylase (PgdA/CDA1 family)